ncbi:MAG: hypothetical protein WCG47_22750 [Dermatophilaceae bacterium]
MLCINLRHLPATTVELEAALGVGLSTLLTGMTAPIRLLVVDGADAIAEGMLEPFRHLADAALRSDVTVLAVTSADVRQLVRDALPERDVTEFLIPPLNDDQIEHVVATFPEVAALATNPRARELLRRPVVVDLLVRGGLSGTPLGDADAMTRSGTGWCAAMSAPTAARPTRASWRSCGWPTSRSGEATRSRCSAGSTRPQSTGCGATACCARRTTTRSGSGRSSPTTSCGVTRSRVVW